MPVAFDSESADLAAGVSVTVARPNGRLIKSLSLLDQQIDPLEHFSDQQSVYRVALGDICFMARKSPRLDRITTIYFVPEYPSGEYKTIRKFLTFYGIVLSKYAEASESIVELRAWDETLRILSWSEGLKMLREINAKSLSEFQIETISRIEQLDACMTRMRPNIPESEMRAFVGSATGGRIELGSLVNC